MKIGFAVLFLGAPMFAYGLYRVSVLSVGPITRIDMTFFLAGSLMTVLGIVIMALASRHLFDSGNKGI